MTELLVRYIKIGIAFALFWALLIFWTSCSYKEIKGKEMAPGLSPGKNYWILIKERTPEKLATDDIIAFEYAMPGLSDKEVVRAGRVHGLPGQRVKMVKGDLFINGRKAAAAFGKGDESFEEIIVPRDSLFILMDNRDVGPGMDSRAMGPLGSGAVLGKVKK
jgi:signal peptidase I